MISARTAILTVIAECYQQGGFRLQSSTQNPQERRRIRLRNGVIIIMVGWPIVAYPILSTGHENAPWILLGGMIPLVTVIALLWLLADLDGGQASDQLSPGLRRRTQVSTRVWKRILVAVSLSLTAEVGLTLSSGLGLMFLFYWMVVVGTMIAVCAVRVWWFLKLNPQN